jgi:hypothetical protein
VFFHHPTSESLADAMICAEKITWDPQAIRANAERFSEGEFLRKMGKFMTDVSGIELNVDSSQACGRVGSVIGGG